MESLDPNLGSEEMRGNFLEAADQRGCLNFFCLRQLLCSQGLNHSAVLEA